MTKVDDGGPAFPQSDLSGYGMGPAETGNGGMSLRDWFAGRVPQVPRAFEEAYLQSRPKPFGYDKLSLYVADMMAAWAYCYADAMIAARGAK